MAAPVVFRSLQLGNELQFFILHSEFRIPIFYRSAGKPSVGFPRQALFIP